MSRLTLSPSVDSVSSRPPDGFHRAEGAGTDTHSGVSAPSYGSLKTEEKTKRQCGQFVEGSTRRCAVCQFCRQLPSW